MKNIKLSFLIILFLSSFLYATSTSTLISFTDEEKLFIEKNITIKVANEMEWPPFDYVEDGKPKGYGIDHIKLVAKKAGINIEFINGYTWEKLIEMFKNRQIDVIPVMYKTKERESFTLFTDSYLSSTLSLYSTKENKKINSINDLDKNLIIGMQSSDGSIKYIKERFPNVKIVEIDETKDTIKSLSNNKVDAIIENPFIFHYFINKYNVLNIRLVDFIEPINNDFVPTMHIGVRSDMPLLHSILQKSMDSVSEEEKENLYKNWVEGTEIRSSIRRSILTPSEKKHLEKKEKVTMCIDPDWMPFEKFKNGKHIGMTAEYFKLFEEKIGVPIVAIPTTTWTESIEFAKERKCDIFSLAMETKERKEYMNFTREYLDTPLVITSKIDTSFIADPIDIMEKKLGITKGYAFIEILKNEFPNIKLLEYETLNDGLHAVAKGEIFGYVDNLITSGYAIQKNFIGELKIAGKFDNRWKLGIGVRNDDLVLLNIFEKVISSIDQHKYEDINNKWVNVKFDQTFNYEILWKVVLFFIVMIIFGVYHNIKLKKYISQLQIKDEELQRLNITDSLTQLYNRGHFDKVIAHEFNRSKRSEKEFIFAILDVDNFKKYNDTYGHQAGDDVLKKVSKVLKESTQRSGDFAFRIGGEEFAIILQSSDIDNYVEYFETICKKIYDLNIEHEENTPYKYITVSIGASKASGNNKDITIDQLYKITDDLLYKAKKSGRNKVVSLNII